MPLEILVPLVVVGIGLAYVLVRWLANAPPGWIKDDDWATERFRQDFPTESLTGSWLVSDDKRVAVAAVQRNRPALALIKTMGSKQLTRLLSSADVRSVVKHGNSLEIVLNDFTLPSVRYVSSDLTQQATVKRMLDGMVNMAGRDDAQIRVSGRNE